MRYQFGDFELATERYELRRNGIVLHIEPLVFDLILFLLRHAGRVVSRDERESGLREVLNFGHTFAHALESVTRYRVYRHGEAVAWGMIAAALLGHEVKLTPAQDASRIISLVRRLGPLPPWPSASPAALLKAMGPDKKSRGGVLRFVLSPRIGRARTYDSVAPRVVERVLHCAPRLIASASRKLGVSNE